MIEISNNSQLMDELKKGTGQNIHLAGGDYSLDEFSPQCWLGEERMKFEKLRAVVKAT